MGCSNSVVDIGTFSCFGSKIGGNDFGITSPDFSFVSSVVSKSLNFSDFVTIGGA